MVVGGRGRGIQNEGGRGRRVIGGRGRGRGVTGGKGNGVPTASRGTGGVKNGSRGSGSGRGRGRGRAIGPTSGVLAKNGLVVKGRGLEEIHKDRKCLFLESNNKFICSIMRQW
ncbi:hypothetical protein RHMOL_Rhmol13G0142000 [Rhododendron molle]|uniref:Uncharacterized protein n=1 Tax=Rhododendron molle TaxID=49168 RepID=A0ACC0L6F0_RHOML|nr:hypothetical protein RHMOL_Rhmol13G0142000 [Rhododendron molle]